MSLLKVHEIYLKNLEGLVPSENVRIYMEKDKALAELKEITGVDFGYDVENWRKWIADNLDKFDKLHSEFVKSQRQLDCSVVPDSTASQFVKNPQFFKSETAWKASGQGTGIEYKVFQQEIDWNLEVEGISNLERANAGGAPYIMKDGAPQQLQLHHSRQNAQGPLFELSRSTHLETIKGQGREAVHPFGNKPHPDYPVNRPLFKKEVPQYWMDRAREAQK